MLENVFKTSLYNSVSSYSFKKDMGDKELKFWTTQPNCFLVACPVNQPDKVLGCVSYKDVEKYPDSTITPDLGPGTVEVNRMAVDKACRGLGIGQQLMESLLMKAKKEGYSKVYLSTSNGQASAIRLYRRMGFKEVVGRLGLETAISKYLVFLNGVHIYEFSYDLK